MYHKKSDRLTCPQKKFYVDQKFCSVRKRGNYVVQCGVRLVITARVTSLDMCFYEIENKSFFTAPGHCEKTYQSVAIQ